MRVVLYTLLILATRSQKVLTKLLDQESSDTCKAEDISEPPDQVRHNTFLKVYVVIDL